MDYKAMLLSLLGLPEDASDEAISAAIDAFKNPTEEPSEEPVEEPADPKPEGGVEPLAARIDALEKRADEAEKAGILAEARAAGKVVALAADALATLSVAQLRATVEATPVTVPLSALTPAAVKEQPSPAVDSARGRIFELCGVPEAAK